MKKVIFGFIILLLAFLGISACNKFGDLTGKQGQVVATLYNVKINQPDSLLLVGAKTTDHVLWSVLPSGYDSLVTKNNVALFFFKKAGSYTVNAVDGLTNASTSINVSDSVYYPVTQHATVPLTGDQITLTPYFFKSQTSDSTYLSFSVQTKNSYCNTSSIKFADSVVNNSYDISLLGITVPVPCIIGATQIGTVINFTQNEPNSLPNGTFPLNVTLNGTTYTGSITASSTTITFNWTYTSGVLISPTQISR